VLGGGGKYEVKSFLLKTLSGVTRINLSFTTPPPPQKVELSKRKTNLQKRLQLFINYLS